VSKKQKHAGGRPPLDPKDRRESLTVRVPRAVIARLKEAAAERAVSVSAIVEWALHTVGLTP
jgi:predicted HicB family RNase H-like nuclease